MMALAAGLASQNGLAQTGLPQGINTIGPTSRTPRTPDVARRRAHKAALKASFTLIQLDDFEQRAGSVERAEQWRLVQAARLMDAEMVERAKPDGEEEGAGFVEKHINYEEDGDVLFA